ncbi:D-glycero-beta-D-manno-heptose 1-phosphate adenylyltransferase [Candidatus Poribacteria bacterium]|nr:D-glycero-beta-D-manno-heptose 1-phosphate adenylyltransferase [Candidatus Poribacteria bacterium]
MILSRSELAVELARAKQDGRRVVTTNGVFDLLHVGHVRYLQQARALGDLLVVGVNSDASVQRIKGPLRPIVPESERAEMLDALACVDYVTIFGEDTPCELLDALRPDIHVKGGDYTLDRVIERQTVEKNGGRVVVGIRIEAHSTTDIISEVRRRFREGAS